MGKLQDAVKHYKKVTNLLDYDSDFSEEQKAKSKPLLLAGYLNCAMMYIKLDDFVSAIDSCDKVSNTKRFVRVNQILEEPMYIYVNQLYSVSSSSGSDLRTQTQLVSACTHSSFLCAREPVCAISLGASNLELRFANKHATSLPGDDET